MKPILLTICVVFYSWSAMAQNATGEIDGKIINNAGEPVSNAQVYVQQGSKMKGSSLTDSNGAYRVAGLLPGSYSLVTAHKGMVKKTVKQIIVSAAGGITYGNMQLQYNGSITGTITDRSGKEVANAFISVQHNGAKLSESITNGHGEYTIADLKPGQYELVVAYPGNATVTKTMVIGEHERVYQADIQMEQIDGYKTSIAEKLPVVPARNVNDFIGNVVNYGVNLLR